jgi:transcriptional regulator with XRE-family HTH domain
MTKNPIRALREANGLTQDRLAMLCRVSHPAVAAVECGRVLTISQRWRAGLESLGADFGRVQAEYTAWRESAANEALA